MSRTSTANGRAQIEYEDQSGEDTDPRVGGDNYDEDTEPGRPQRVTVSAMLSEIRELAKAIRGLRSLVRWAIVGSLISSGAVAILCLLLWWSR